MSNEEIQGIAFQVRGRVQGVAFRWFGRDVAQELEITGWIRNRADGGVEGEAFGGTSSIEQFLARLRQGPQLARVDHLESTSISGDKATVGFEIRY